MLLNFSEITILGSGHSPQAIHMMDNGFTILYIDDSGNVSGDITYPELGMYENLSWKVKGRMSLDSDITFPSIKKIAHNGAYGFWSAAGINNTMDHKFIMYMLPFDISDTFIDGNISYSKDSPVSSSSFKFVNVGGKLLRRYRSIISPNTKLEFYLSMGNSPEISLGKWYIDRVNTSAPGNVISVTTRNAIGKLLKEQTFDENATFTYSLLNENLAAIMQLAEIDKFFIGDTGKGWRLTFEPQTSLLEGIQSVIQLLPGFIISENIDGTIGIGRSNDTRFDQPTTYVFERDKTCFSYSTEYSDEQTYNRICVICSEPANVIYLDLPPHKLWTSPTHKTLFVTVPNGASINEMNEYANNLADSIAISGRVETFDAIFTPQMVIGDIIEMVTDGVHEVIGVVTSIRHTVGQKGFYTEFTVDSSGRKGKPMLKDYLSKITGRSANKSIISNE